MTSNPIIHKYHFSDMREQILAKLETILQNDNILSVNKLSGYKYIYADLKINNELVKTTIVLINDSVMIHNSFPSQPDKHDRLWMISSFLGQITYIEIENPDLRSANKVNFSDPMGNAYEMHAMPLDYKFLDNLLNEVIDNFKTGKLKKNVTLNSTVLKNLNIG